MAVYEWIVSPLDGQLVPVDFLSTVLKDHVLGSIWLVLCTGIKQVHACRSINGTSASKAVGRVSLEVCTTVRGAYVVRCFFRV